MSILTGKQFNKKYAGVQFVKLTNKWENHNGFQFKNGLNVDCIPFNIKSECSPGGIYFCRLDNFTKYINYGGLLMYFIRIVNIPDSAQIFEESNGKYKSDKIILSDRMAIFRNNELCMIAVKQNGDMLKYIERQTPENCLIAVQQNGYALQHVKQQTHEICLVAIKQNKYAFLLIQYDGTLLEFVKIQTPELCLIAVTQNGYALEYVKYQSPEICLVAVQQNGIALCHVKIQTPEICLAAVKQNGRAIRFAKIQTPELCYTAIAQDIRAIKYIIQRS